MSGIEPCRGGVGVAHQRRLGDLERDRAWVQAGERERVGDLVDQVGVLELAGGDVDRDPQRTMLAMPGRRLFAGRLQHPAADRDDQPGRFRERYERVRRDHATDRVAPADQRLDAGDRLALQVERRLVEQEELAGVERVLEVDLECEPVLRCCPHPGLEHDPAVLARALGFVQREVGIAEKVIGRASLRERDPDTRGHRQGLPFGRSRVDWLAEYLADPLGDELGPGVEREILEQHDELVPAEPSNGVSLAHDTQQARGDDTQQLVAGRVAEAVVDALEVIDIHVQGSHPLTAAASAAQHLLCPVDHQYSVGQACERVVQRLVAEPPLGSQQILLRDELADRDERCEQHRSDHQA